VSFKATVLQVFIASPGDLADERVVVADQINIWNRDHAASQGFVFVPTAWEWAVASQGYGGQEQINRQQVHHADVVIAMFKAKLGQPTQHYQSGTAEEISVAYKRGAQVSVLVSNKPAKPGVYEGNEYDKLKEYLQDIRDWGLTQSFSSDHELRNNVDRILWKARSDAIASTSKKTASPEVAEQVQITNGSSDSAILRRVWPGVLRNVQRLRRTTQILMESAVISEVRDGIVYLTMPSAGLARRAAEPANADLVAAAIRDLLDVDWEVYFDHTTVE